MINFSHDTITADANNLGTCDIDPNVVAISIEPDPQADDGFTYGIGTDPQVHMDAGDAGRDYGPVFGPYGFEMIKQGQIKFKWDGVGATKKVLVIKTVYIPDNC